MALNPQQLEGGSTNNSGSEPNTTSIDELAGVSALTRGSAEVLVIQSLERFMPAFEPLIRKVVKEEMGLAEQRWLTILMKENPANTASTSLPKKLKLKFIDRISLPVLTGKELLGEKNQTPIGIILVDALTEQIVNIGIESTAKLEIVILHAGEDDILTLEEFQKRIVSEKKLQGNTCLQLKDGIGFVGKISFTHGSKWTKTGWYRLGAIVVDAAIMAGVEVAWTEAFLMKDRRTVLYEKHYPPSLLDNVYHLDQISFKAPCYKRLKAAKVTTVKDILTLVYTNPKRLEDLLKLKASSKTWDHIIKHAQTSDGMFLYLDSCSERKTGVVLDVKLQLKGLIVETHQYTPFNHLSDKQKVDAQSLVKFASEHFDLLHSFKDEASLREFLQSDVSLRYTNQIIGLPSPSSQATTYSSFNLTEGPDNLDYSNSHTSQTLNQAPVVTSQVYNNYYECDSSFKSFDSFDPDWQMDTLDLEYLHKLLNYEHNTELHSDQANSESDIVIMTAQTVSVCTTTTTNAQTRWTKVSKLIRKPSVRERISPRPQKKQRCF